MKDFCCTGNLSAILQDSRLPEGLKPFVSQMTALFEQSERSEKPQNNSSLEPLPEIILDTLTKRLNSQRLEECIWVEPAQWESFSKSESLGFALVPA